MERINSNNQTDYITLNRTFNKEIQLNTLNTLGKNVTKDSVIIFCMREKYYLISDEPNFRMTFKNNDNITLFIYYSWSTTIVDYRYIEINEAKMK